MLTVSNIGSSGQDGYEIYVGPSAQGGLLSQYVWEDTSVWQGTISQVLVGQIDGVPDLSVLVSTFNLTGDTTTISVYFGQFGATGTEFDVYNGGDLVYSGISRISIGSGIEGDAEYWREQEADSFQFKCLPMEKNTLIYSITKQHHENE